MSKKFIVGAVVALVIAFGASSASAAYMHSTTLKMGVTSSQVMELQKALNMTSCKVAASGAGSAGMESMYFGAKTKAAVQCYQMANGLTADGVVGAMTGAKLAMVGGSSSGSTLPAGCTSTSGFSPVSGVRCDSGSTSGSGSVSTGGLTGGAGSVEEYKLVSSLNDEEVGEDTSDVKVAGLEIEADDESDLQITAVKLTFDTPTTGSDDLEDYADNVTVWFGDKKVADLDADEINDDNDYAKTISLASGAIIRAGEKGTIYVALSGASNIDSDDLSQAWGVTFTSVRFVDAQGAVVTEDPNTDERDFTFESFATANDIELNVSLTDDEDDVNDSHTITVDEDSQTDNVSILAFTLENKGDADITVNEIPVVLTVGNGSTHIEQVVSSVDLYHGSTKIGSEDVSTGTSSTVTFDDLDLEVGAGDEEDFWVKVNLFETDGNYVAGVTLQAQINDNTIDAEDETGEDLDNNDLTGSAVADAHALYEDGITVTSNGSTSAVQAVDGTENDYGAFTIKFSVTAVGEDMYLDKTFVTTTSSYSSVQGGNRVAVVNSSGTAVTSSGIVLASSDSDSDELTNTFRVREGKTADFTLTINSVDPGTSVRAVLYGLEWALADDATGTGVYTFNMGVNGDYKTDYKFIND